ncbi:hypothetical protein Salmuc_01783 [Salipiger mucosus DSM 16094]|uniref:Uncharacterized protein n=2 Tax=Salipiger mucosus TaxID=263378 RepID=S9QWM3_9RHOB|nr:hypothetical protein Salmuc_01783 [Salipiger mucosus DSM 16094]
MYKADMGVAFDDTGALVAFDVLKQQKLLAGNRVGQGADVLIFPVTETNKREITTLKKSVGGLVYRAILERSWELYKKEMEFVFVDGELQT